MTDYSKYEGHTPGPWISNFASVRIGVAEGTIAKLHSGSDAGSGCMPQAMFNANKALIADAPALLARVKELEAELGCLKALFSSSKTK